MKRFSVFAVVFIILALLAGCKETPALQTIIDKGDGRLADALGGSNSNDDLLDSFDRIPSLWDALIATSTDSVTIRVSAPINIPEISSLPVVELAPKGVDFTALEWFVKNMATNGHLALPATDNAGYAIKTKSEIAALMEKINERIEKIDSNHPEFSESQQEAYMQAQKEELSMLQEQYALAPDEEPNEIQDVATLSQYDTPVELYLIDENNLLVAKATVNASADKYYNGFTIGREQPSAEISSTPINNAESAIRCANQILDQLGYSDEYAVFKTSEGRFGISVHYARTYHGIPYSKSVNAGSVFDNDYRLFWPEEELRLTFTRDVRDIKYVSWFGQSQIIRVINDNVGIMAFDEIQQIVEANLAAAYGWTPEGIVLKEVIVDEIALGYKRIPIQNRSTQYMLVPAWTLNGSIRYTDQNQRKRDLEIPDGTILVINAIDGSLIYSFS